MIFYSSDISENGMPHCKQVFSLSEFPTIFLGFSSKYPLLFTLHKIFASVFTYTYGTVI